ncbi:MAG: hypothetical protein GEU86_22600 [Actinophytocola sp.]|nr:hypothetical protein [Actinophytocola sp.]
MSTDDHLINRRTALRGGALALAVEIGRDGPAFLSERELTTLRALVDRIVPGKPEDPAEGAVFAGCAEAIDGLLGAFRSDPPRIYAGAPFSDRGGHPMNEFENFLPLDSYEATAWRLRIEGSRPGFGEVESGELGTRYGSDEIKTARGLGFPDGLMEPYTTRTQDEAEYRTGVQGDVEQMPAATLSQSPRSRQFVMPPNPTGYAAKLLAEGARRMGYTAYPYPAAVNSRDFDGRSRCNSCGLCSGFGCPINARGDALVSWLNPAVLTGRVRVIDRAFVYSVETTKDGRRARRVRYRDAAGREKAVSGDIVVLAGSPINTARLLLMSANGKHPAGLGNRSDQVGRNMMFHNFTLAAALYAQDVQPLRAQSTTLQIDDMVGPFTGPEVAAIGVPYVKGGIIQTGSGGPLLSEAALYSGLVGYGTVHKQLMRLGLLHARVAGCTRWTTSTLPTRQPSRRSPAGTRARTAT